MAVTKTSRNTIANFSRFDNSATNNTSTIASQFVVVAQNGQILSSPDTITWTLRATNGTSNWNCFKRNGVLYSPGSSTNFYFSTNGTTWTANTTQVMPIVLDASSKTVTQTDEGYICSPNANNSNALAGDTQIVNASAVGFASIGRFGRNIIASFNAAPWVSYSLNGVTFLDATGLTSAFEQMWVTPTVAIATNAATGGIFASTNGGATWSQVRTGSISGKVVCKQLNGVFIVSDATNIYTSTNGTTWNAIAHGTGQTFRDGTYANGLWVLSGSSGSVLTSPDATTWTARTTGAGSSLNGINYV